ncbi:MAG: UDP-N-acetylmuramate dehydrogenase [Lysobacteraceae bacterium]
MSAYNLIENAPLDARSSFRVSARAELLADLRQPQALGELLALPWLRDKPVLTLGEGSNLLFAGDVDGLVLSLANQGIRILERDGERVLIRAEAGERWDDLVRWSVAQGLHGLENLALIPGSVGAAPIQNIGAYGAEAGEFIRSVEAFDRHAGRIVRLDHGTCAFGYRDSLFKRQPERWIITALELELDRSRPFRLDYAGVRETLAEFGDAPLRPSLIAEAISRLRSRKLPNPMLLGNAGSFFKNPLVDQARAAELARDFPGLPLHGGDTGQVKVSAAWLIEHCGWKGFRDGDAGVAAQHALVLVNHGQASGRQILDLARRIADSVRERFAIDLEPEPRIVGATW